MAMALVEGDRISQLPDEILVTILSLLDTWEAGRTCVLSKRWTYFWTYVTSLNFDGNDGQHGRSNRDWGRVSRVLGLHQGSTVNEFRVHSPFKLDSGSSFEIDDWVKFAMRKRVRKLVLHLRNRVEYVDKSYSFPRKLFESTFAVSWMESLTHLSLKYINITDDLVEHFLSNCQLLQHLCVSGSKNLVNLKVVCLTFVLKFLEISDCSNLQKVDVVAPSYLMSFIYHDYYLFRGEKQPGIVLEQTPSFVKVSLGDGSVYRKRCGFLFQPVSRSYPQLEILEMCMNRYQLQQRIVPKEFTTNLKDISLTIFVRHYYDGVDFFGLTSLIEHSPFLSRFSLKLKWGDFKPPTCMSNVPENSKGPHQCLKVVEIFGFIGYTDQNEATIAIKLAKYLIQNAVALETVFIKQETHISTHKRIKLKRELRDILPPGAKLTLKRQTHN